MKYVKFKFQISNASVHRRYDLNEENMSHEKILSKLKSEKDNKVIKAVEDAASAALQMDITMCHVEMLVSRMKKSPTKSKLKESLKHLNRHWTKVKSFASSSANVEKWKNGKSLAVRKLSVQGIVNPKKNSKDVKNLLDRSIKNMNRLMEGEYANKENMEPVKVRFFKSQTRRRNFRKVKKHRVWRLVKSKNQKGITLKIPSYWGEPKTNDEYTPRELLDYLDAKTPPKCMRKFLQPLIANKIVPVSYDAVMYVRHLHRSLLVS